jgi:hypothetical protein
VITEADLEAVSLHADNDQPDAHPGVEPAVQQSQLWRARRQMEEAEGGTQEQPTAIVRHSRAARAQPQPPRRRPACVG